MEVSPDSNPIAFIGNEGYILLFSSRTKELIGALKINQSARRLAFADGGQQLLSTGGDGHASHWNLRTRRCIPKGTNEGSIGGSALCASQDNSLFAAVALLMSAGERSFFGGEAKSIKDHMKFNPDTQIMA